MSTGNKCFKVHTIIRKTWSPFQWYHHLSMWHPTRRYALWLKILHTSTPGILRVEWISMKEKVISHSTCFLFLVSKLTNLNPLKRTAILIPIWRVTLNWLFRSWRNLSLKILFSTSSKTTKREVLTCSSWTSSGLWNQLSNHGKKYRREPMFKFITRWTSKYLNSTMIWIRFHAIFPKSTLGTLIWLWFTWYGSW